jgi:hypothetical protein
LDLFFHFENGFLGLQKCYKVLTMNANGPLVWAVSVGGAARRCVMLSFSRKTVPAASHHGAIFASPGE